MNIAVAGSDDLEGALVRLDNNKGPISGPDKRANGSVASRSEAAGRKKGNRQKVTTMLYKFDTLFKKELKSGGVKVVTYTNLLENPEAFGPGEGFADAQGELSMVLEGLEAGFSINALMHKYRAQLVGHMNAEMFGKESPCGLCLACPMIWHPSGPSCAMRSVTHIRPMFIP